MKVREIKHTNGDRPLILMGWGAGAAIAAHVAGVEKVNGKIQNSPGFDPSILRHTGIWGAADEAVKIRKWQCTDGSWNTTDLFTSNNWRILATGAVIVRYTLRYIYVQRRTNIDPSQYFLSLELLFLSIAGFFCSYSLESIPASRKIVSFSGSENNFVWSL